MTGDWWLDGIPLYACLEDAPRARITRLLAGCGTDLCSPLLSSAGWRAIGNELASHVVGEADRWQLPLRQLVGVVPSCDLTTAVDTDALARLDAEGHASWTGLEALDVPKLVQVLGPAGAQNLLAAWIAAAGTEAQAHPDLLSNADPIYASLDSVFRKVGHVRALNVWWTRSLGLNRGPTLREIGARMGVSGARAQQLDAEGAHVSRGVLQRLARGPVGVAAEQLHAALGTVYPLDHLSWPQVGLVPSIADAEAQVVELGPAQVGLLLLRLAGPYTHLGGWLERSQERWAVQRYTVRQELLEQVAQEGGLTVEQAHSVLAEHGVVNEVHADLLASYEGIITLAGQVHLWPEDATGRLETVLRATDRPMRKSELARLVQRNVGTVSNILMGSPRFARFDQDLFGLADWPGQRYAGVIEAIEAAIRASGGVASTKEIFGYVLGHFSVAENSIRTYLNSPEFVRVKTGHYRLRGRSERARVSSSVSLEESSTCFRLPCGWALRMRINDDRLRGSGLGITQAFALHVGLEPGEAFTFPVEVSGIGAALGWVRFTWPRGQMPAVGSVSQLLNHSGVTWQPGDWLFLAWDFEHQVMRLVIGEDAADGALTETAVRARIGSAIGRSDLARASARDALSAVAEAVGLPDDVGRSQVIQRLRVRKDHELIAQCRVLYDLEAMRVEASA